jgi:hypothetical protein
LVGGSLAGGAGGISLPAPPLRFRVLEEGCSRAVSGFGWLSESLASSSEWCSNAARYRGDRSLPSLSSSAAAFREMRLSLLSSRVSHAPTRTHEGTPIPSATSRSMFCSTRAPRGRDQAMRETIHHQMPSHGSCLNIHLGQMQKMAADTDFRPRFATDTSPGTRAFITTCVAVGKTAPTATGRSPKPKEGLP